MHPSVTQVLSVYADFSRVRPETLELAADRGRAVHAWCASLVSGSWMPMPENGRGYCLSFAGWFDQVVIEPILWETRIVDEVHWFSGQPDLVALLRGDSTPTVIDYKTPTAKSPLWAAQLAAYSYLVKTHKFDAGRAISIRLDKDGRPPKIDEYSSTVRDFQAFLNALYAYRYFNQKKEERND